MTSKAKLNFALLIAIGFLILIIVYKPGKDPEDKYKISKLAKSNVNHIRLERIKAEPIEFSKVDGQWEMLSPFALATTQINVESLLDLLDYNYHAAYDKKNIELKKYDLEKPHATIIYNKQHRFDFGTTEALNKYRYLSHQDKMYVTDDYFHHRILGPATSFLSHALLPEGKKIVQIDIPNLNLKLNDGTWTASPMPENFSNDQANELADKWSNAHAENVMKFTSGTSIGKISINLKDNDTPLLFELLKNEETYYLARIDLKIMYKLTKEQRRDLLQLPPAIASEQIEKDISDANQNNKEKSPTPSPSPQPSP